MQTNVSHSSYDSNHYCDSTKFRVISPTEIEVYLTGSLKPELDGLPSVTISVRKVNDKHYCLLGINELEDGISTDDMKDLTEMMTKIEANYSSIYDSIMTKLDCLLQAVEK